MSSHEEEHPTSDCTFIFNDGNKIGASKLALASRSPVFEQILFGKLSSSEIVITDIALEEFQDMLNFICDGSVKLKSVLHAWSLFYVSHKYVLDNLGDVCIEYIARNLNINNLILNYEYAEMYGVLNLQNLCISDIIDYVRGIFSKHCDYHMKPTSLLTILKQKTLNISGNELIIGVLEWAVIECDINTISLTPKNVTNLLKSDDILYQLIDLDYNDTLISDEFAKECCKLIQSFKNGNNSTRSYLKKHWCIFCKCRQIYKIANRIEMRSDDSLVSNIEVNHDSLLYGLVVVTENEQIGDNKVNYNGIISIQISSSDSRFQNFTKFEGLLPYESSIYVPLSQVIHLEANETYSVKIGYQNLDNCRGKTSSIVCNYMSNKLIDQKTGIAFSFLELDGGVIRGISYYPL